MNYLYTIKRTDTGQYYYSLTPNANPLWTDEEILATRLTERQADEIYDLLYKSPYKHNLLIELDTL